MAGSNFEIRLSATGLSQAVGDLRKFNKELQHTADLFGQIRSGGSAGPGGGGRIAQTAMGPAGAGRSGGGAGGPFSRLAAAQAGLRQAIQSGDPVAIADRQYRLMTAQKFAQRAQNALSGGPTTMDRIGDIISTSRFGSGIMPLVGKVAGLLGIEKAALGPIGIGVGAMVALGMAARKLAEEFGNTVARVHEFNAAATLSGGRPGDIAALSAIGIAPGAIAGKAAALRERLSTDPMAMVAGASIGVGPQLPRPFGRVNEAEDYLRVLDGLRSIRDADEQVRKARMLGVDADLELIRVSDQVWQAQKRDIALRKAILSDTAQNSRDAAAGLRRVDDALQDMKTVLVKPFLGPVANGLNDFASGLNAISQTVNNPKNRLAQGSLGALGGMVMGGLGAAAHQNPVFGALWDSVSALIGVGQAINSQQQAIQANTDALNMHAMLLRQGTWGGGQRARYAGRHSTAWQYARWQEGQILRQGGFTM